MSKRFPYTKEVVFNSLTEPNTYKPVKRIEDIDTVFLFVTTYFGSYFVLNVVHGGMDLGTDKNKRIYFRIDKSEM